MTKPNWNRTLSEVLKHPTKEIKLISEKQEMNTSVKLYLFLMLRQQEMLNRLTMASTSIQ